MSDNFEFDDNDDMLMNSICTPPFDNIAPEENDENLLIKRAKRSENTSPIIQVSHSFSKTAIKSTLRNKSHPNAAKRIFPGPAGILSNENQTDFCSQETSSFFQDGPWEEMSKDFKISNSYVFDKFNIAWIKKEATANKFANQKAPFLAGILLSLEVSEGHTQKTINITLRDMTGTIQGTILQNLYKEYASHFTLGSVLVLIQFGVLSCTCDNCDNHHLTITPKNLSAIYSGKEKIVIKQVDPEEVLKQFYQRKKELELAETCRNLIRQNNSSSPIISSANRCTYGTNRNTRFQSPCASRSVLSSNIVVNKSINTSENNLQKTSSTSESFTLPKFRLINQIISETRTVTEVHESKSTTNLDAANSSTAPKKLFTFKTDMSPKANILLKLNCSPLSNASPVTILDSSPNSLNTILKPPLCVKVDNVEHEKIWKEVLEDIDVNSLFEDDFIL